MQVKKIIAIAPMMQYTDRHFRYLLRLITRHTLLYTEMVTTGAILYGPRQQLLAYHPAEHPVALQLGGSDPAALAECARIVEDHGYDEINLNVGCPSDRVQNGRFGACLMKEPDLVAQCIEAMVKRVRCPVTVKNRIGVDELDSYDALTNFIKTVSNAGCKTFIIHARKAWLKGLSPKENREIPPLHYEIVHQLKQDYPKLKIIINGGIKTLSQINAQIAKVDGVMLGREAYHNPYMLSNIDAKYYGDTTPTLSRIEIIQRFLPYLADQLREGVRFNQISKHLHGIFHGCPGGQKWRKCLGEIANKSDEKIEAIKQLVHQLNSQFALA